MPERARWCTSIHLSHHIRIWTRTAAERGPCEARATHLHSTMGLHRFAQVLESACQRGNAGWLAPTWASARNVWTTGIRSNGSASNIPSVHTRFFPLHAGVSLAHNTQPLFDLYQLFTLVNTVYTTFTSLWTTCRVLETVQRSCYTRSPRSGFQNKQTTKLKKRKSCRKRHLNECMKQHKCILCE